MHDICIVDVGDYQSHVLRELYGRSACNSSGGRGARGGPRRIVKRPGTPDHVPRNAERRSESRRQVDKRRGRCFFRGGCRELFFGIGDFPNGSTFAGTVAMLLFLLRSLLCWLASSCKSPSTARRTSLSDRVDSLSEEDWCGRSCSGLFLKRLSRGSLECSKNKFLLGGTAEVDPGTSTTSSWRWACCCCRLLAAVPLPGASWRAVEV